VAASLSYADAIKLLRDPGTRFARVADRLTASGMLGAVVAVPEILGWFDARSEFARLSQELVQHMRMGDAGMKRYDRTRRIEAAHSLVVVTAYFKVLQEHRLPVDIDRFELTKVEQVQTGTGVTAGRGRPQDLADAVLHSPAPLPSPEWGHDQIKTELLLYYRWLSDELLGFLSGLATSEALTREEKSELSRVLRDEVPPLAVSLYEEMLRNLAGDVPDVLLWIQLREHSATREAVRTGLETLRQILDRAPSSSSPQVQVDSLIRAYSTVLDQPIVESRGLPDGLTLPAVTAGYIDPHFRSLTQYDAAGWRMDPLTMFLTSEVGDHGDLAEFFAAHLTTTQAAQTPLLVLGQPGSGKSLLTKVLAARLADSGFLPVRVALSEVPADQDVQDQIEYAVRAATGERVSWPELVRLAGTRQPVVLLDGLDELVHAAELDRSGYLTKVRAFQQRELSLDRPVAVVVTSRTGHAERFDRPEGSISIELAPFTPAQIAEWVKRWNSRNRAYFGVHELRPLELDAVRRQGELAGQPLLLLLLALYDATANALLRADRMLSTAELYEHVMVSFTERELRRRRHSTVNNPRFDMGTAVARELDRLSIAAFATLNRGRPAITQQELGEDLEVLLANETDSEGDVTGRFFFVHESNALTAGGARRAFEFLHATFAEFLVARLITRLTSAEQSTGWSTDADRQAVLRALLSFTVLANAQPLLPLIEGRVRSLDADARHSSVTTLTAMTGHALGPWHPTPYDAYQPQRLPTPTRHATYSANLVVLLLLFDATPLSMRALFPDEQDPASQWRHHASLWRSSLSPRSWSAILAIMRGRRTPGTDRDVVLVREDGSLVSHRDSASLAFYADPALDVTVPEDVLIEADSSFGRMLRAASLLIDHDLDLLLDALAPYVARHGGDDLNVQYGDAATSARETIDAAFDGLTARVPSIRKRSAPPPPPPPSPS
jgi:hypothetical protein